jgi:gas vesicle protein GvpL/GvpF
LAILIRQSVEEIVMSTSHTPITEVTEKRLPVRPSAREKIYLYAIVLSAQERVYGEFGIDGHKVYSLVNGELSAVVSDVKAERVRPERARLSAHHEILKKLMAESTPLPMAFGIVADSPAAVRKMLGRNQRALAEQLRHVAGKVEMGLRVKWDVPNIFEYFVKTHPELRLARDRLLGVNSEPTQEHKIEIGSMFDHFLNEDRETYADQTMDALSSSGFEIKPLKCRNECEVMNLACLVLREDMSRFETAVFEVAKPFDNNFALDYNGPWAPHNFVDVDLEL